MQDPTQEEWENLWSQANGGIYQSWKWIELHKKLGRNIKFIIERDKSGRLNAGLSFIESNLKTPLGTKKILRASGNPLSYNDDTTLSFLKELKNEVKNYFYCAISPLVILPREDLFNKAGYKIFLNYTILIELNKEKDELWKQLEKKSARWGIKIAEKNSLKFELAEKPEDLEIFYELYTKTTKKGNFHLNEKYFIDGLKNTNLSKMFLIKLKNEVLAGGLILLDYNNKIAVLNLTSSSDKGLKLQAMPFLYWNIILYCKSLNFAFFDLGGYDAEAAKDTKEYNINKFKERFGGRIIEQPVFSTNWKYPLLRKSMQKMRFLKKIYKKLNY